MFDADDFDPALAGAWPVGRGAVYRADIVEAVDGLLLETKSEPSPAEALQSLLNEMQGELKAQFDVFKKIRVDAQGRLDGTDEGEIKLAKADVKSASDALSLIVRTIEKVDGLQRTLAEDRMRAEEESFDDDAYQQLLADIDRKINERVDERARMQVGGGTEAADAGTGPPGSGDGPEKCAQ
ncbi:hypothetical protein IHQ71_06940 [Rhizobium sp. TH2]|uniref:hypothetical protein n=1 Tax=Rhizobium sp. TH2 TaxID=2775403 RepID=UPI0021583971|nr:hypothetical protein [Rhizobium sp. TH2]UVC10334.1 hypothetical protein IHQ71_06940 [Rhizobium sp. TH2]